MKISPITTGKNQLVLYRNSNNNMNVNRNRNDRNRNDRPFDPRRIPPGRIGVDLVHYRNQTRNMRRHRRRMMRRAFMEGQLRFTPDFWTFLAGYMQRYRYDLLDVPSARRPWFSWGIYSYRHSYYATRIGFVVPTGDTWHVLYICHEGMNYGGHRLPS
jgi:hypothetical protein